MQGAFQRAPGKLRQAAVNLIVSNAGELFPALLSALPLGDAVLGMTALWGAIHDCRLGEW